MKKLKLLLAGSAVLAWVLPYAQTVTLTNKVKAETVANIARSLTENYVYLDTAKKMAALILEQLNTGAYDTIKTPGVFSNRLTADLLSVYHDGHLSISYNAPAEDINRGIDTAAENERRLAFRRSVNFGWNKAEILTGNTGYLQIAGFFAPDSAAKAMAEAALCFVSNSNALVIDLRGNMGGSPDMVSYICGFFFARKTHLNDLYTRSSNTTAQYWAVPAGILNRLNQIPIYVLTSHQTFSAGEEFCYDLQTQRRATIIGEATGGGAHPVSPFSAGNGFTSNVPFARAINPITGKNWEGKGVQPDIYCVAGDALNIALSVISHK
ncbi:MAG TPA: S41 family peptidase [Chitinophagaceae bacterium]|nr:S41 family peptidase [Chitinophagaceae bacterium]